MTVQGLDAGAIGDEIKFDIKNADDLERVATVRENKWEHGMETHVRAEANMPKLESLG
jgi:hypothetical protein